MKTFKLTFAAVACIAMVFIFAAQSTLSFEIARYYGDFDNPTSISMISGYCYAILSIVFLGLGVWLLLNFVKDVN